MTARAGVVQGDCREVMGGSVTIAAIEASGSRAAVAENRDAMGIELDAHHVQIIRDRLGAA